MERNYRVACDVSTTLLIIVNMDRSLINKTSLFPSLSSIVGI